MLFEQRMYAHVKFLELMAELYENEFEDFFHRLMCLRYPDFLDVRTAGSLGDRSADGLSLHSRKLYACYAPQTVKPDKIRKKFDGDLSGAVTKRNGEFDTFVFVHNDRRGVHPEVTSLLASARNSVPSLRFEQMGTRRLWHECMQLDQMAAEDVLRCEIPIKDTTFGIGMEDLAPLLKQLQDIRAESNPLMSLPDVPIEKLDFNRIEGADREDLLRGMRQSYLVDAFYSRHPERAGARRGRGGLPPVLPAGTSRLQRRRRRPLAAQDVLPGERPAPAEGAARRPCCPGALLRTMRHLRDATHAAGSRTSG